MLTITREGNVITVLEEIPGWSDTKRTIVRYNMDNWTVQVNNDPWREMDEASRHWVVKHYLPKAKTPN